MFQHQGMIKDENVESRVMELSKMLLAAFLVLPLRVIVIGHHFTPGYLYSFPGSREVTME